MKSTAPGRTALAALAIVSIATALGSAVSPDEPAPHPAVARPAQLAPVRPDMPASDAARLEGWYTKAQARRGQDLYKKQCAACHGVTFVPDDFSPGLTGAAFEWRWKARTAYDLFEAIRVTMPPGEAGSLGPRSTAEIVAYLLQENGFPSGSRELPAEREELERMLLKR